MRGCSRLAKEHAALPPLQAGNEEDIEKYSKRTVRVTREHNEECKRLLKLMGVPIIEAPSEAEAQCAALNREGLVRAISGAALVGHKAAYGAQSVVCGGWGGLSSGRGALPQAWRRGEHGPACLLCLLLSGSRS